jgi:hypothetical protein
MAGSKPRAPLSPRLEDLWGFLNFPHLVSATDDYIVFLDDVLEIEWKTTDQWDKSNPKDAQLHNAIFDRATTLEYGDWDGTEPATKLNFKRRIGDAIARCLEGDYDSAQRMLDSAENYKREVSERRLLAIDEQIRIKDEWRTYFKRWNLTHYFIGIAALLFSTLVASKPETLGFGDSAYRLLAWLVAFLTGVLTLLTPDKKAGKYNSAWSLLSSQITRYKADKSYTVNDVLDAYQQGQDIITGTSARAAKKRGS